MKLTRYCMGLALSALFVGCATYQDVKEIRMVGFEEDISKGKNSGQIEANDCVFHVMGYWLGGSPEVSRAIANARTGKQSSITDVLVASNEKGESFRYLNNMKVKHSGFNAYVFGRNCIEVSGVAYK